MIVNAYAVLTAFVSLLQLVIGLLVIVSSRGRRSVRPIGDVENRPYLLLMLGCLLLGVNLASWPLLYALMQSYVPSWPGVMCIYGVTRIGAGSVGSAGHLPWLLATAQCTKPLLVFLGGGWFVLYLVNRAAHTAPLMPRLLSGLLPLGVASVVDAVCVGAYLAIPKQEQSLSVGCCTSEISDGSRLLSESLLGSGSHTWLSVVLLVVVGGMCLGLLGAICKSRSDRLYLGGLLAGAIVAIPLGGLFLVEIASPVLLQRPHHCPYDLVVEVPESVLAVVLFAVGCFSVGWAAIAAWLGHVQETRDVLPSLIGRFLFLGLFGYLGSMIMFILECTLS
ncbi:MAG: hypothetical protein VX304_17575 [Planctomycetota bacterium]|nr:hypothetical protein [Planctomycetota bacterium]